MVMFSETSDSPLLNKQNVSFFALSVKGLKCHTQTYVHCFLLRLNCSDFMFVYVHMHTCLLYLGLLLGASLCLECSCFFFYTSKSAWFQGNPAPWRFSSTPSHQHTHIPITQNITVHLTCNFFTFH